MLRAISRRALLNIGISGSLVPFLGRPAAARYVSSEDGFQYEVTRTETEWRNLLGEGPFQIMRTGHTEKPKSSPMWSWDKTVEGTYRCKGCDLDLYESRWKVVLDKGWLFYSHGIANALLMGVDWPEDSGMQDQFASLTGIETHCRRCGSHMGHIVIAAGKQLHCINGASLAFAGVEGSMRQAARHKKARAKGGLFFDATLNRIRRRSP